jgi:hypothetical protein
VLPRGRCDANEQCAGYTLYPIAPGRDAPQFVLRATTQPHPTSVNRTTSIYARMHDQRSDGGCTSCVTYLKAAAGGAAGPRCLEMADASTLVHLTEYVPRDDDFETDGWAPVIDGVDLAAPILDRIDNGSFAPDVDVLLGSNMDEGTIFMYLAPPLNPASSHRTVHTAPFTPHRSHRTFPTPQVPHAAPRLPRQRQQALAVGERILWCDSRCCRRHRLRAITAAPAAAQMRGERPEAHVEREPPDRRARSGGRGRLLYGGDACGG